MSQYALEGVIAFLGMLLVMVGWIYLFGAIAGVLRCTGKAPRFKK